MRLWSEEEVQGVLGALAHAHDALPRPFRWLLAGWREALATLGVTLAQRAKFEKGQFGIDEKVWSGQEIAFAASTLYDNRKRGWDDALAAASLALCGQLDQVEELDAEIWSDA